jgi:hypothetical protein
MMAIHGAADSSMAASFFYAGNSSPLTTHVGNICPSTGAVRILGTSAQSINMGSPSNNKTNGNNLTIFSGSVYATNALDKNAGDMIVSSGSSSGTGTGKILFNTATAGTTGTTLRTPTTKWIINGAGNFYNSSDTYKIILGAGDDMSIIYDGTKGIIDTSLVTASDLQISCGTDKTIVLNESVWDDLQFLISGGKIPPSNYPDWDTSFTTNTGEYKFEVNDYIDLAGNEMPHTYKQGTTIKPHLHLALDGANSSGSDQYAKFTLYIAYADANEVWTETSKTAEITIPTGTADLTHLFLDMGDLTFTNQLIGCQIKLRLKRIAATGGTEYPNHIFVTQVGIHHEIDTMGSRGVATK